MNTDSHTHTTCLVLLSCRYIVGYNADVIQDSRDETVDIAVQKFLDKLFAKSAAIFSSESSTVTIDDENVGTNAQDRGNVSVKDRKRRKNGKGSHVACDAVLKFVLGVVYERCGLPQATCVDMLLGEWIERAGGAAKVYGAMVTFDRGYVKRVFFRPHSGGPHPARSN